MMVKIFEVPMSIAAKILELSIATPYMFVSFLYTFTRLWQGMV